MKGLIYIFIVACSFAFLHSCKTCVDCINCYQLFEGYQNNTGVGKICAEDYKSVNTYGQVVDSLREDGCICE